MITKETQANTIIQSLLNCGYQDVEHLLNLLDTIDNHKFIIKGEETFLFSIDDEGKIFYNAVESLKDNMGEDFQINFNAVIHEILSNVAYRINDLYGLQLEEGLHYEIYTNFLDSHLWLIDEDFSLILTDEEKQTKEEIKNIFLEFN